MNTALRNRITPNGAQARRSHGRIASAFTLIELLVVISVIALLIGILMPAIGSARGAARQIVGASLHKQLSTAQLTYAYDHRGAYAGPNTSNIQYLARSVGGGSPLQFGSAALLGNTTSTTPVSTHDWISPILGDSMGFSENRAERTADIFNNLACPAATRFNDLLFGDAEDLDDFEEVQNKRVFNQISFLSPMGFHYWPTHSGPAPRLPISPAPGSMVQVGRYVGDSFNAPVEIADSFRRTVDAIATPSSKILVTDGCRYLDGDGVLDFDVDVDPGTYGSFLTSSPIFHGSRAFARPGSTGTANLHPDSFKLSIRHGGFSSMNVSHFDGSVSRMTDEEAYTDPTPWFPAGSVFTGSGATPESIEFMAQISNETGESQPRLN